eukprot:403340711
MSARNYDKCERCRNSPATLECVECGTSTRPMKHCYECDRQYHKMFEKENHTRIPLKFETNASQNHGFNQQKSHLQLSNNRQAGIDQRQPVHQKVSSPLRQNFNDTSKSPLRQGDPVGFNVRQISGFNISTEPAYKTPHFQTLETQPVQNQTYNQSNNNYQSKVMYGTLTNSVARIDLLSPSQLNQQSMRDEYDRPQANVRFEDQALLSSRIRDFSNEKSAYKRPPIIDYQALRNESVSPFRQKGLQETYTFQDSQRLQNQHWQEQPNQLLSPRDQHQQSSRLAYSQSQAVLSNPQIMRPQQSSSSLLQSTMNAFNPPQHQQIQQHQSNHNHTLSASSHIEGNDLTLYYQRMAEDYRAKYLELERDYIFLKNGHDYEVQRVRVQVEDVEKRFNEKLAFELQESERNFRDIIQKKDFQISQLQQQLLDMEARIESERQELITMSRVQSKIEKDYQDTYREFERSEKDNDEKLIRLQKEHDYQLSKQQRKFESEKDQMKKDYESLIDSLRSEYQMVNQELKNIIDKKTDEALNLSVQLKKEQELHRNQRSELEDTLQKDKYQVDLCTMENEKLRQARGDFESERESLYKEIKSMEAESDRLFSENKELKRKVKKLEHILYGKK